MFWDRYLCFLVNLGLFWPQEAPLEPLQHYPRDSMGQGLCIVPLLIKIRTNILRFERKNHKILENVVFWPSGLFFETFRGALRDTDPSKLRYMSRQLI